MCKGLSVDDPLVKIFHHVPKKIWSLFVVSDGLFGMNKTKFSMLRKKANQEAETHWPKCHVQYLEDKANLGAQRVGLAWQKAAVGSLKLNIDKAQSADGLTGKGAVIRGGDGAVIAASARCLHGGFNPERLKHFDLGCNFLEIVDSLSRRPRSTLYK